MRSKRPANALSSGIPLGMPLVFCALALCVLIQGCVKDEELVNCADFNRSELLSNWADNLIVPTYGQLVEQLEALDNSLATLQSSPSVEQLDLTRLAYVEARGTWQQAAFFDFGPAASHGLLAACHVYPCNTEHILANASANDINLSAASNVAAGGFEGLDFLLFGAELSDEDVLALLTDNNGAPLIAYAQLIGAHMLQKARAVSEAWNANSGYREVYVTATGTDVGSSLGLTLNAFNRVFEEHVRKNKLGLPSGAMTFTMTPLPDHVEGYYSRTYSLSFLTQSVEASQRMFEGSSFIGDKGLGIDDYLDALGAKHAEVLLSEKIAEQLNLALDATLALDGPLASTVESNQALCLETYAEIQQAVVLCKVDLMSALGILVTYQDNDGD